MMGGGQDLTKEQMLLLGLLGEPCSIARTDPGNLALALQSQLEMPWSQHDDLVIWLGWQSPGVESGGTGGRVRRKGIAGPPVSAC